MVYVSSYNDWMAKYRYNEVTDELELVTVFYEEPILGTNVSFQAIDLAVDTNTNKIYTLAYNTGALVVYDMNTRTFKALNSRGQQLYGEEREDNLLVYYRPQG